MSKIVIGVACHKPAELPENDIYLPIHVGAAISKTNVPGTVPDDTGDNISAKNPMYCELTAQYWLWKNVDADYYGLCHYRRYMSFASQKFTNLTPDERKQVLIPRLDSQSKEKYYLNNESAMRAVIEAYDIVATEEQDLRHVFTPNGHQGTVYKHFAAHDHDLINVHDLNAMVHIVERDYPQYAADMKEYLDKPYFRGFNCFVMKKDLFFELCSFEFDVLAKLEEVVDTSTYDVMRSRIYGFMAEILYSSFVYHVEKTGRARVKSVQMLYFKDTDPVKPIVHRPGAIPVMISIVGQPAYMFDVTARSFAQSLRSDKEYDLIVLHSETLSKFYMKKFSAYFGQFANVRLNFLDWDEVAKTLEERCCLDEFPVISPHVFAPWYLPSFDRIITFDWNVLFEGDWSGLVDIDFGTNLIAAAKDVEWIGEINGVYNDAREYVSQTLQLKNTLDRFSTAVTVIDLQTMRTVLTMDDIVRPLDSYSRVLEGFEAANVVFDGFVRWLPQSYNVKVSTYYKFDYTMADLPLALANEYKAAKKSPIVIQYDPQDPFWNVGTDYEVEFWEYARQSEFYESFIENMVSVHVAAGKHGRQKYSRARVLFDKTFPEGTKRRGVAKELVPRDSPVFNLAKDMINRLR